jgi:hypothetical protein
MYSLADYKNRVRAERAVTDWLTSDSVNWRSLSVLCCEREYQADALALPAFPNRQLSCHLTAAFAWSTSLKRDGAR